MLQQAASLHTYEYTDKIIAAIIEASNSDDRDLMEQSWLTMHSSLRPYEDDFLKRTFGIYTSSREYEDYIQEIFVVIMTDLHRWDPSTGAPTTFFKPRFLKACIAYRNLTSSTFSSSHYDGVYSDIKKATAALEQQGIQNPTPLEIRNYIAVRKKPYSEQTIVNCLEQVKDISSLDNGREVADRRFPDPLSDIVERERADEIEACIQSLEPQHRLIMEICRKIYREDEGGRKHIANRRISEEFRNIVGPVSDDWIKNIRTAAENSFKRRYNSGYYRKGNIASVRHFPQVDSVVRDEDIRCAIMKDMDAFFGDSEEDRVPATKEYV